MKSNRVLEGEGPIAGFVEEAAVDELTAFRWDIFETLHVPVPERSS